MISPSLICFEETKIDRLMEVCFHHTEASPFGSSTNHESSIRSPEEVEQILQFYQSLSNSLDTYLISAWNKKKGIFEDFPFIKSTTSPNHNEWEINPSYVCDFVPRKSTKVPKTPLFKPFQMIIQHLVLIEVSRCTLPSFNKHQIMHAVMSRFPLSQKQEGYEYGMKMLEKLQSMSNHPQPDS